MTGFPRDIPQEMPFEIDIERAWSIVSTQLQATPLIASPELGDGAFLKLETWQPTGSFKVRGALTALSRGGESREVVTASTGNHALAVAFAADRLGIRATVVVPVTVSAAKIEALSRSTAAVLKYGESFRDAERYARTLTARGLRFVSAYNDPDVIAGQATVGIELLSQLEGSVTVVCSIGNGGLAAGLGLAASVNNRMTVIGVEASASIGVSAAIQSGHTVEIDVGYTLADGLDGNPEPGAITIDLIKRHVGSLVSVTDEEIAAAIRYLAREHGLIAEGAGAAPVAAILFGKAALKGQTVAVIGGRNISLQTLAKVLSG
jgi:threonine dehydratase